MAIQQNQQIEAGIDNNTHKKSNVRAIVIRTILVGLYFFLPLKYTSFIESPFALFLLSCITYSWHPHLSTTPLQMRKIGIMAFAVLGYRYIPSMSFAMSTMPALVIILQVLKYPAAILALIGPFWGDKPEVSHFSVLAKSWPVIRSLAVIILLSFEVIAVVLLVLYRMNGN